VQRHRGRQNGQKEHREAQGARSTLERSFGAWLMSPLEYLDWGLISGEGVILRHFRLDGDEFALNYSISPRNAHERPVLSAISSAKSRYKSGIAEVISDLHKERNCAKRLCR